MDEKKPGIIAKVAGHLITAIGLLPRWLVVGLTKDRARYVS